MDDSEAVRAATSNENRVMMSEPCCHLYFEVMLENDARAVGLPYRVELASGVFEGETDGAGRFRVDTLPADDYLVEIAGQRMHLTSFSRREEARRVMLLDCVVDGSPIESADSEGSGA